MEPTITITNGLKAQQNKNAPYKHLNQNNRP